MEITLEQLAALTRGTILNGDAGLKLTGFGGLRESAPGDLSFCAGDHYVNDLRKTRAGAVLVNHGFNETIPGVALVACENASAAFGEMVKQFLPAPRLFRAGIHPSAVIHPEAKLDPLRVCIGPCAVVEAGAVIGEGTEIGPGSFVGENAVIGKDCLLHPRVTVYHHCLLGDRVRLHSGVVIGADGFGYEFKGGVHRKIEQVGIVQIDNDVEIGANSTVDRARFGRTWIGEGSKIDNLVMIAHNCVLGKHVIVVAQVGIAGSTRVGDYSVIAAQTGVGGHLEIGSQVTITARSGVTRNLLEKGTYSGHPVAPIKIHQRSQIHLRNIEELVQRVRILEKELGREPASGDTEVP